MKVVFLLLAIAAGIGSALQSGSNSSLQKALETPLWAILMVAGVTVTLSCLLALCFGGGLPTGAALARTPWWAWLGGVFGTTFLFATVVASGQLGAGVFVALVVTSSTVTSLALDHFGWMGFDVHAAGLGRIVGGLLMVAGVACIAAF